MNSISPAIFRLLAALAAIPLAASPAHAQDAAPTASGASFVERFATFDARRWLKSDGWSNGAHQKCTWTAANAETANGALELSLRDNAADKTGFTCAEIQSHGTYGYGVYEVRLRAPAAPGLVTAFFTYIGRQHGKPHDEIDFEFLGKDSGAVQLNYFADGHGEHEYMAKLGFDAEQTTATYAFEWSPYVIRWYINGEPVHERRTEAGKPFPSHPGKIFLSIWSGEGLDSWLGKFAYPGQPLVARYELVAFTKAGDACQFPESLVCKLEQKRKAELEDCGCEEPASGSPALRILDMSHQAQR